MKIIKILKPGWIFIIITILLGVAAINTGNNLVYLITSFLLGVMGASGYFGKKNISNLEIDIIFPDEIFANKEFNAIIKLKNKKKIFPSLLIKVESTQFSTMLPFTDSNEESSKNITLTFNKRGYNVIKIFKISSKIPFNFFERYSYIKQEIKILVYPEPIKTDIEVITDISKKNKPIRHINHKGLGDELYSIRDFIIGDNKKFIHWKISAKLDELKVKEFSEEQEEFIFIEFDKIKIRNIERKISAVTFLIISKKNIILKMNNKVYTSKREMLKALALL